MGLLKLALIGGAGYFIVKKLSEDKQNKRQYGCQCGANRSQQQPESSSAPQYPAEKQSQGQTQTREVNTGATQQQQQQPAYHDFEPNYQQQQNDRKTPVMSERALPAPGYFAGGGEQKAGWNEKGEYHRSN